MRALNLGDPGPMILAETAVPAQSIGGSGGSLHRQGEGCRTILPAPPIRAKLARHA